MSITFGQIAFEAYGKALGHPLWGWMLLDNDTKNAWEATAITICKVYAASEPVRGRGSEDKGEPEAK